MLVLPYIRLLRGRRVAGRGSTPRSHLVNAPKKGTNPGPPSQQSRHPRGDPERSRSSPRGQDHAVDTAASRSPGPTPTGGEEEEDDSGEGRAWPQPPGAGNSPNGAAPDFFLANMHPPRATAPQSGERRARRRPASGQGPDLAQLQHRPLLLSERCRGTRAAGGEPGRAPRGRGGSRRECAAPGPAAPPSAASAAPPARLRALRGLGAPRRSSGLLEAPRGSSGLRAPRPPAGLGELPHPPHPPLRSAGCRHGREPAAAAAPGAERSRAAPSARPAPPVPPPPPPPPRARLLPRRAAA